MTPEFTPLYCANHPKVESGLRCKNCGKPICAKCAVLTPTGYSCKECLRSLTKRFETAQWYDYILGPATAFLLSSLTSLLITLISTFSFLIIWIVIVALSSSIAAGTAEILRFITRKRRSKRLFTITIIFFILGALLVLAFNLLNWTALAFQAIYLLVGTPIVYYRLSGIHMSK
ncbi:MAG: hypothetical protein N2049_07645 [Anaerolineales bacterium]|nr:hypothetical protein [Anaerolineales bacterium]MCX7609075.1 hypothetical protein [Anaerolineales bacterium]MDW8226343.1 hypothetical protein [Anaerolineales bacterium]